MGAFVGDDINHGPALGVSHVGIAMPRGADIARATADIVRLDDRLAAVAREIAGKTMRMICGNFTVAATINTGILGGAVLGLLSQVANARLQNGATIGVLVTALKGVSLDVASAGDIADHLTPLKQALGQ